MAQSAYFVTVHPVVFQLKSALTLQQPDLSTAGEVANALLNLKSRLENWFKSVQKLSCTDSRFITLFRVKKVDKESVTGWFPFLGIMP